MARLQRCASFILLSGSIASETIFGYTLEIGVRNIAKWIFVYGLALIGIVHLDREVFKRIF